MIHLEGSFTDVKFCVLFTKPKHLSYSTHIGHSFLICYIPFDNQICYSDDEKCKTWLSEGAIRKTHLKIDPVVDFGWYPSFKIMLTINSSPVHKAIRQTSQSKLD